MMEMMNNTLQKMTSTTRTITSPDSTNCQTSNGNLGFNMSSGNPLWTSNARTRNILSSSIPEERSRDFEGSVVSNRSTGTSSDPGSDPVSSDIFKVFVRLKPFPKGVKLTRQQLLLYKVINPAIIINLEDVEQDLTKNVDVVGKKFRFSEAFGADVSQVQLFERVVKPQVVNLFAGMNSTVMTYGPTTSGKSYTLEGSLSSPGLIPMALDFIFSREKPVSRPNYKLKADNTIEVLNSKRRHSEIEFKKRILLPLRGENVNPYMKVLRMVEEGWEFPGSIRLGPQHEIWISFLEIRDEKYYDLLSPEYQTQQLPLHSDTNAEGQAFVKALRHLHAVSIGEARDMLTIGRNNFKKLNSTLNRKSSQSHCIFNITLLKYDQINRPEMVQMSRFSFCDLAGHQESPDLDISLLALVKCVRSHYESHSRTKTTEYLCPSSLTSLFKSPLTGNSSFSLITHVDPNPGMYKETHEALHFTAVCTEILTKIRNVKIPQVITTFGKMIVEGADDFSKCEDLTPEQAGHLASSFQHAISGYQALDLKLNVEINKIIIKKHSSMMDKLAHCYQEMELLKLPEDPEHPEIFMMHEASMNQLKSAFEKLQEGQESAEQELADALEDLNEINSGLPSEYKLEGIEGIDRAILLLEKRMEIQQEKYRTEQLTKLLNEARTDVMSALHQNSEEKKKLDELERKYVALKLDRDMDLMLSRHTKKSFKLQLENIEKLKSQLERMTKQRQMYEARCEDVSQDLIEIEGSEGVDADGTVDIDEKTNFIDLGIISDRQNKVLTAPGALEVSKNQVDKVQENQTSLSPEIQVIKSPTTEGIISSAQHEVSPIFGGIFKSPENLDKIGKRDLGLRTNNVIDFMPDNSDKMHLDIMKELEVHLEEERNLNQVNELQLEEINVSMDIDESEEFKIEISVDTNQQLDDYNPVIIADPQMEVVTPPEVVEESKRQVDKVPQDQPLIQKSIIPDTCADDDIIFPKFEVTSLPEPSTAVTNVQKDLKCLQNHPEIVADTLKESHSCDSWVTGSSVDLQPPELEAHDLLENLVVMKSDKGETNSSLQNDSNDVAPPQLEMAAKITSTPLRRSRRTQSATHELKSSLSKAKKKVQSTQRAVSEDLSQADLSVNQVEANVTTSPRRSNRKRRYTRRFISPVKPSSSLVKK